MAESITTNQFRKDIYRTFDRALETGVAQLVVRNGQALLIVRESGKRHDLDKLPKRDGLLCTPEGSDCGGDVRELDP